METRFSSLCLGSLMDPSCLLDLFYLHGAYGTTEEQVDRYDDNDVHLSSLSGLIKDGMGDRAMGYCHLLSCSSSDDVIIRLRRPLVTVAFNRKKKA